MNEIQIEWEDNWNNMNVSLEWKKLNALLTTRILKESKLYGFEKFPKTRNKWNLARRWNKFKFRKCIVTS